MILYDYPEESIRKKILKMKSDILSRNVPFDSLIMRLSIGPKYKDKSYPTLIFINNHKKYHLDYKAG